ncbi:hypothetical protein O3P69_008735 [Scylla paramamosain]|uniref:Uncharacterized protein n=1 Tax=Scylla paramamosain TaxID=85552 RepID=A0AAW0SQ21_SCYPA
MGFDKVRCQFSDLYDAVLQLIAEVKTLRKQVDDSQKIRWGHATVNSRKWLYFIDKSEDAEVLGNDEPTHVSGGRLDHEVLNTGGLRDEGKQWERDCRQRERVEMCEKREEGKRKGRGEGMFKGGDRRVGTLVVVVLPHGEWRGTALHHVKN